MNAMLSLGLPGGSEWIVLLAVVFLLFGGTRLPQLAKGLGQSIKEFKKGVAEIKGDVNIEDEVRQPTRLHEGVTTQS